MRLAPTLLFRHQACDWTLYPDWQRWSCYLRLGLFINLLFITIYGGANIINAGRDFHFQMYFSWERNIPLVESFVYPYLSILLMFLLPPFALDVTAMRQLGRQLAAATLFAGTLFLLLPTQPALPRNAATAEGSPLFAMIYAIDLPHNLFPSLHITYSTLLVLAFGRGAPRWLGRFLSLWLCIICMSVLLTHQHQFSDLVGGLLLACLIARNMVGFTARSYDVPPKTE